jgi:HK97 gp10 family phage protein
MAIRVRVMNEAAVVAKLKAAGISPQAVLEAAMTAGAEVIKEAALRNAPGPNIDFELDKKSAVYVEASIGPLKKNWHYRFAETGTRAHAIRPKRAKALKLYGVGDDIYGAGHTVGGVRRRPFLRPAIDENQPRIREVVGKPIKDALDAV